MRERWQGGKYFPNFNRGLVWELCFQKAPDSLSLVLHPAWPFLSSLRVLKARFRET